MCRTCKADELIHVHHCRPGHDEDCFDYDGFTTCHTYCLNCDSGICAICADGFSSEFVR